MPNPISSPATSPTAAQNIQSVRAYYPRAYEDHWPGVDGLVRILTPDGRILGKAKTTTGAWANAAIRLRDGPK